MSEQLKADPYQLILLEAQKKAAELKPSLPGLPTPQELEPYLGKIWAKDRQLIDAVRRHLDREEIAHGHGFENHIEWVAGHAAYITTIECEAREVIGEHRDEIIQRAWRLGLVHDLERWRGFKQDHATEGRKAAAQLFKDLGIKDDILLEQIELHDNLEVEPRHDPRFDIPFFSVFAIDHLNWGREWEESKWIDLSKRDNMTPKKAVEYYKDNEYMYNLQKSPNLQQTVWGREVALPYVNYGIAIAEHVERSFS